ncbi:OmpA family protein [Dyadobacter sp. 22481]|uniref:OmpA family protein n=1 Tax=Dyadobacter sp. 22481 TaxID=3453926 RepID=UPI003F831B7E
MNKLLKDFYCISGICLCIYFPGVCQSLSGEWSGQITQTGSRYGNILIQIKMLQNGNAISGEIKTIVKNNFIVQEFTGSRINGEILINERKVLKEVGNLDWYLKRLRGRLAVDANKMIIYGTWNSQQAYQFNAYVPARYSGGTFQISLAKRVEAPKKRKNAFLTLRVLDKNTLQPINSDLNISVSKGRMRMPLKRVGGHYIFETTTGETVQITVYGLGYESFNEVVKVDKARMSKQILIIPSLKKRAKQMSPVGATELKAGDTLQLLLHFEQSSAVLLPDSEPELEKVLRFLIEHPSAKVELIGHTDNVGDPVKNFRLSGDRVNAIKGYLVGNKISAHRIYCRSMGGRKPIAENSSEENRKKNRRVEMRVVEL